MTEPLPAAYGLRLRGPVSSRWLAVTGAGHWPTVTCAPDASAGGPSATAGASLTADGSTLLIGDDVSHAELVHPLLGRLGSRLALATGGDAMHAGALATAAGAWVVIGPKMAGKSTLLAALARAGSAIVTDDVLVFRDGRAMAGPRCIDLRPDAPGLGPGTPVRPSDPRHRMRLPAIAAEHPLAGVIHLEWGDDSGLARLGHRDAITRLLAVQREKGYPRDPGALLDLATLPTVVLRRPRTPAGLAASVELVAQAVGDPRSHPGKIRRPAVVGRS